MVGFGVLHATQLIDMQHVYFIVREIFVRSTFNESTNHFLLMACN